MLIHSRNSRCLVVPASETMSQLIHGIGGRVSLYVAYKVHRFSIVWLYPLAHSRIPSPCFKAFTVLLGLNKQEDDAKFLVFSNPENGPS